MKEFFKKIVDKIKAGINKIKEFFKKNGETLASLAVEVTKMAAGVGISALIFAMFKHYHVTSHTPFGLLLSGLEWIGVFALMGVLSDAADRYIESELEETKAMMNEILM